MGYTANWGIPYPDGVIGVAPDVPGDMKRLADSVDGILNGFNPYNPSIGGAANLSAVGEFVRTSRRAFFTGVATFVAGGSVGNQITMSLPVPRRGNAIAGRILAVDSGSGIYELVPVLSDTSLISLLYRPANGGMLVATGNQVPFGWSQGDQIIWDISYSVD